MGRDPSKKRRSCHAHDARSDISKPRNVHAVRKEKAWDLRAWSYAPPPEDSRYVSDLLQRMILACVAKVVHAEVEEWQGEVLGGGGCVAQSFARTKAVFVCPTSCRPLPRKGQPSSTAQIEQ